MTTLTLGTLALSGTRLGPDSPLPAFRWQQPNPHQPAPPVGLNAEESEGFTYMGELSILPYGIQNRYSRSRDDLEFACLTLENDLIRVQVLPELGGRVYSMVDKSEDRELLFCNPVIQMGNLSLRNAWFSGGIEWNGGSVPGHAPTSCETVYCARIDTEEGPVLRLYEFDRISETAWQVDLHLPEGEKALYVHGKIVNPNAEARPVYWWTNATVAHVGGQRVLSPADYAIEHALPDNHLERFRFPNHWGFDGSYPGNWQSSTSVFFRTEDPAPKWLAAVNPDGKGLGQRSTANLTGRKFFYFGYGDGGRHWMEFLSTPEHGGDYIEIQSGVMPTQNQRHQLAAKSEIEWTECFFPIEGGEACTRGEYGPATAAASQLVEKAEPGNRFDDHDAFLRSVAGLPVSEVLVHGQPWGSLHESLTGAAIAASMTFAGGAVPSFWHAALDGAAEFSGDTVLEQGFATSKLWCQRLQDLRGKGVAPWFADLHLGIAALDAENFDAAEALLSASSAARANWLAERCLAVLHDRTGAPEKAAAHYAKACTFGDAPAELHLEHAEFLKRRGMDQQLEGLLDELPPAADALERTRILRAEQALKQGDFDTLETLLEFEFATIREGETTLSNLWTGLIIGRAEKAAGKALSAAEREAALTASPVPFNLDFVMLREERIAAA